jgi:hypothetical protein
MKNKFVSTVFVAVLLCGSTTFAKSLNKDTAEVASDDINSRTLLLEKKVQSLQNKVSALDASDKKIYKDFDLSLLVEMYAHGPAVVTSPALGARRSADDASDLAVNLPSMNEDLVLLKVRQKMNDYAAKNGIALPERPLIFLSGALIGGVSEIRGYNYITNKDKVENADINLTKGELDAIFEVSPWATGGLIVKYEETPAGSTSRRIKNSRIKLDRGFLTIGQLDKSPLYFTMGQIYAPFGVFGSSMIDDPATKNIGRYKDRMAVLGFYREGLQAQVYAYPGETKGNNNVFDHSGFNLAYEYSKDKFKISVGGSVIGNFAETDGMQDIFGAAYPTNEPLKNRVYGIDGRIKLDYKPFSIAAEYVGAAKRFDVRDISFNNEGARPAAMNVEGKAEVDFMGKTHNFALGYGHTWQALALKQPKDTLYGVYSLAIVKNAILGFEYKHDINYAWTDTAVQKGITTVGVSGRHTNTVLASLGIFF